MRESEIAQLRVTLSNPMDCSPPDSSTHGIFQARVLELGAIAFSSGILRSHKKNEVMPFVATWMDLEIVIVTEVRRRQVSCDITHM